MHEKNEVDRTIKKENLKTVFVNSFEEIKKEFDFSVVFHEDFLGRKGTLELIETAGKKTKLKGKIYFSFSDAINLNPPLTETVSEFPNNSFMFF